MGKGFYVSKLIAVIGIVFSIAALATIIALAVVYSQEKTKNFDLNNPTGSTTVSGGTTSTTTSGTTSTTTSGTTSTTTSPTTASTTPASNEPWDNYRLPKHLVPYHYDIHLRPVLEPDSRGIYVFHGKSEAFFTCVNATSLVIIHTNKLNYSSTILRNSIGENLTVTKVEEVRATNYLVLHAANSLVVGQTYSLYTDFIGELADDLAGFYRSEYVEDGERKIIATTQMQAPDARKAFPCFDEPALKATFNITLVHKPDYVALSNMNPISATEITIDGVIWTETVYDKTVKMSTYLVAFVVSQFTAIGDPGNSTTTGTQIWGRKKAIDANQGEYALSITKPILDFFINYYNIEYPLPKSDQVAIPDFSAGAMENWGLMIYRESALLYDPEVSSISNKERIAIIIAHELAHQWFGNLVTIRWWNDLWLNEGFASYVEFLGADRAEPTWNIKDLIVLTDVFRVMAVDALASSHPLTSKEEDVNTPAEISELFDSITYNKGASVIRMLSDFITEEVFVVGLHAYLRAFEYDSTVYSDLWTHLQVAVNASGTINLPLPIADIMDTWVLQMGFPVVKIDTQTGIVTQSHFLLDPESVGERPPSEFNYIWKVPISYTKTGAALQNYWLQDVSETNSNFQTITNEWLLANINVTGYYRVNYDDVNWDRLILQLRDDPLLIPVINRAQIIDDAFNLARAQHVTTERALETTRFLSGDNEYMPWQAALNSLSYFMQMFDRSEVFGPMKEYLKRQVTPVFEHFKTVSSNFTNRPGPLTDQYSEINAITTACSYGNSDCIEYATNLFNQWRTSNVNGIHPNLRSTVYCTAISEGGEAEWDFLWDKFATSDNAQESDKLRAGLACSREPWILNRFLDYSLDTDKIRRQDAITTISNICNNVIGQSLAWDFVRGKWRTIFTSFGGSSFSFGNLIERVTRRFSSEFELQQLLQFEIDNADVGFGTGTRALQQAKEKTIANMKWVNDNKGSVLKWFEDALITKSI